MGPLAASAIILAWILCALVIEKHFTDNKSLPGNDHYHAMDQKDLERFIERVNKIQSDKKQDEESSHFGISLGESLLSTHILCHILCIHIYYFMYIPITKTTIKSYLPISTC